VPRRRWHGSKSRKRTKRASRPWSWMTPGRLSRQTSGYIPAT
ncbi:hypothetical protein AK812_SmicGene48407, partial [Symbiodinium microadriaticum]